MKQVRIYLLIICFFTVTVAAEEYYVSASGGADFTTIQEAVDRVQADDTVYIKAGTYHERVYIEKTATKSNPIVIQNYQHDSVIVDGTDIDWEGTWGGLFELSQSSYILISGLQIEHSTHAGIFLDNAHYITVQNTKTNDTFSSGIGVWESDHVLVNQNEVKLACNDGGEECISIVTSHHVDVTENEVHHNGPGTNGGEGIDVKQGSHDVTVKYNHVHHIHGTTRPALYADASDLHTHHIMFEANCVHNIAGNGASVASELGGLLEYVTFVNNIIYNNQDGGMIVGGWTADDNVSSNPVEHINIINNTFYDVGSDGIYIDHVDAKDIKIYNNIIQSKNQKESPISLRDGVDSAEVDIRNNMVDSEPYNYEQSSDIVADPLFVDAVHGDFHLQFNSPAIDAGIQNDFSLLDYEKNSRLKDGAWDIGAYEENIDFSFLIPVLYLLM
ncbi:right-handed parallel beta-helix repeat-containing protein [Sulfurovum sp.]|uniref:right-handed parallel beta-helix repeat-containing protein n=1 Tax=Sulfurovum sp. TaxID=1969726 RepID=UPI0025CD5456|nr:right-handed parallel beta-helix repeat-containing protein [Sulfurovum sp.]